ncbi:hypothetical protein [Pseudomonas floridensis]
MAFDRDSAGDAAAEKLSKELRSAEWMRVLPV